MKRVVSLPHISPLAAVVLSFGYCCCCCCAGFVAASINDDSDVVRSTHACFNSMLEISCETTDADNRLLAFDSARYGRNDSRVATQCDVPFSWNCDVDVQFLLNRACAGRRRCSIDVGVKRFTDPCGYAEFLVVSYRCVPAVEVASNCPASNSPVLYDHGYISSPNYPEKYFRGADCRWTVAVRRWQTIRITLFDFELDVKRAGLCHDYLKVSASQTTTTYFGECGATGKQVISVQSSTADINFVAAETSSTQRGFFLYYEAVGPGCPDLPELKHGWTVYHVDGDQLVANATCNTGFRFQDSEQVDQSFRTVICTGYFWNGPLPECQPAGVASTTVTMTTIVRHHQYQLTLSRTQVAPTLHRSTHKQTPTSVSFSYFGIAAGFAGLFFLLAVLLVLASYFYRRCRQRMKLRQRVELKGHEFDDPARVVVNNLQSNNPISRLSAVTKKRDRQQQQQQHRVLPLEHLNILPGYQRRSFKHNQDSKSRRHRSSDYLDSCADDACLAKNLLRSAVSDEDDDSAATGRLRPPRVRDIGSSGYPCASTSAAWEISGGVLAVPSRDCPFCWAQLPIVDNCEKCARVESCQASHRWSTPGIRITSSESPTSSSCMLGDCDSDAKRRSSSLSADVGALQSALRRSVPDIARTSLSSDVSATQRSSAGERWLSAGVASMPRPTATTRADLLPTCLRCPSS